MLETIMRYHMIYFVMGAVGMLGILSKGIAHITLKRLIKESSNMNKSSHHLMRLVRSKFEHACMISDKVENVDAFVDKYIYEHRVVGLRLHTWRQLEKQVIWLYGVFAIAAVGISYSLFGVSASLIQYGMAGSIGVAALFLLYIITDEGHHMGVIHNYMVDYLENVCAHRYSKVKGRNAEQKRVASEAKQEKREPKGDPKIDIPSTESEVTEAPGPVSEPETVPITEPVTEPEQSQSVTFVKEGRAAETIKEVEKRVESVFQEKQKEREAEISDMPQEAIIREILEEFLA